MIRVIFAVLFGALVWSLANAQDVPQSGVVGSVLPRLTMPTIGTYSGSGGTTASNAGIFATQQLTGSTTTGSQLEANFLNLSNDALSASNAIVATLAVNHSTGASSVSTQFTGIQSTVNQTAQSGSLAAGIGQSEFTPIDAYGTASHNEGGTGTGFAQGYGNLGALFGHVLLASGGTNWYGANPEELDIAVNSGASVGYKLGLIIVQSPTDAVSGTQMDAAIAVDDRSLSNPGWACGICFGKNDGYWPIQPTGTILGTSAVLSGNLTAKYGIDLSAVTFSTGAFKSTGFLVDGSGNATFNSVNVGNGVTCSGAPTASFAVTNGIVTHC